MIYLTEGQLAVLLAHFRPRTCSTACNLWPANAKLRRSVGGLCACLLPIIRVFPTHVPLVPFNLMSNLCSDEVGTLKAKKCLKSSGKKRRSSLSLFDQELTNGKPIEQNGAAHSFLFFSILCEGVLAHCPLSVDPEAHFIFCHE